MITCLLSVEKRIIYPSRASTFVSTGSSPTVYELRDSNYREYRRCHNITYIWSRRVYSTPVY